jgi:hypothetical protein
MIEKSKSERKARLFRSENWFERADIIEATVSMFAGHYICKMDLIAILFTAP